MFADKNNSFMTRVSKRGYDKFQNYAHEVMKP